MKKFCIAICVYSVISLSSCKPVKSVGYRNYPLDPGYWPTKIAPNDKEKPVIYAILFIATSIIIPSWP